MWTLYTLFFRKVTDAIYTQLLLKEAILLTLMTFEMARGTCTLTGEFCCHDFDNLLGQFIQDI